MWAIRHGCCAALVLVATACGASGEERVAQLDTLTTVSAAASVAEVAVATESGAALAGPTRVAAAAEELPRDTEPPLPDLVLDAAYLVDTLAVEVVTVADACQVADGCVGGLGQRRVLRFGSRTGNVGGADFVLGKAAVDNPLWRFNSCRRRFDLKGFGHYVLLDLERGATVAQGAKHGFCIADVEAWADPSGGRCERVYDCDYQGISRGCADNYGSALACQWVDVTDVEPGAYELRVAINANRDIAESAYENNVVSVEVWLDARGVQVLR